MTLIYVQLTPVEVLGKTNQNKERPKKVLADSQKNCFIWPHEVKKQKFKKLKKMIGPTFRDTITSSGVA